MKERIIINFKRILDDIDEIAEDLKIIHSEIDEEINKLKKGDDLNGY
jgi:hypothetical protein